MIQQFVDSFMAHKEELYAIFALKHPNQYVDLVHSLISVLEQDTDLDSSRITEIDHGDYQGTLVFIIAEKGYQPSFYWSTKVNYGSCSGCDTLQSIRDYEYDSLPTAEQVDQYLALSLHIVQKMKEL